MPLKVGDKICLDKQFDKNELKPFYRIVSTVKCPDGIDFKNKLCTTVKVETNEKTIFEWQLDWISKVVEGESVDQADNLIKGARVIFLDENPSDEIFHTD